MNITSNVPSISLAPRQRLRKLLYKVHLTETSDDDAPHLVTQVETTSAPATDFAALATIPAGLKCGDRLPAEQLVDAGYMRGRNLVSSQTDHQISLIGPVADDHQWQAKVGGGFDVAHFPIDWDAQQVTYPQGHQRLRWREMQAARERLMIHVDFAAADCTPCPLRAACTQAKTGFRRLTLQPQAEHAAIQAARERQQTTAYAATYAARAGIEGTISQGVRAFGLRQARYRGQAKTHLQHVATVTGINVGRVIDWVNGVPRAATRCSRFAAIAPAA